MVNCERIWTWSRTSTHTETLTLVCESILLCWKKCLFNKHAAVYHFYTELGHSRKKCPKDWQISVDTSLEGQRGSKLSHSTHCMFSKIQCRETETFNRTELNWPVFRVPHLLPSDSCDRLGGRMNELNWIPFLETKFMIIHNRKENLTVFLWPISGEDARPAVVVQRVADPKSAI